MIFIFKLKGAELYRYEGAKDEQSAKQRLDDPKRWTLVSIEDPTDFSLTTNHWPLKTKASRPTA